MARKSKIKDGRHGPSLKLALHSATEPTSPPETPTVRKGLYRYSRPLARDPNIRPVGNGHQFSYRPALRPEQLSPRSASSDSDAASSVDGEEEAGSGDASVDPRPGGSAGEDDSENESTSESESESGSGSGSGSGSDGDGDGDAGEAAPEPARDTAAALSECGFVIEDVDSMDSECEGLDVLRPSEIESSPGRPQRDLDLGMLQHLEQLNCSNEASDRGCDDDDELAAFLRRRQELRRQRRVSMSSSFGKRTHSELSDSDNDDAGSLDASDVGSSARRMRKRLHRGSLLFPDPPAPRIDELEEPESGDEGGDEHELARELPYYAMEIMEMEAS